MGDPLSVAANAIGIISFGIRVCKGLIDYSEAIRGRHQDVDDGINEVQSLLAVFESLDRTITRLETESPENAKSLLKHLRPAEGKLQCLEKVLAEVGVPIDAPNSAKGKMKEAYRAAIYPMKKSKLDGARQNIQSLLGILTLALQTVNLPMP
ncbi:hypothetical protein N0V84_005450 [Fusarium piperis]|uniref:NACHT-NTPase and P-loop NTPases N-terminal domain-containing protein n=1 Tax=Fusarium piperis TaxID=1435070 RepID=A0A9W8WDM7_9HYPO|nr:hypothetical protein N0V84_005450 [Fusarium piperis]